MIKQRGKTNVSRQSENHRQFLQILIYRNKCFEIQYFEIQQRVAVTTFTNAFFSYFGN